MPTQPHHRPGSGFIGAKLFSAAASRTFEVVDNGGDGRLVHPPSVLPTELSQRQQHRKAREWLQELQGLHLKRIETPTSVETDDGDEA